ncbi:LysR family transcriptional regulator [Paenibacillus sp. PDC88]|uniref:LysR family transcriptional regulator n=1 Tax=Paenibacillus sp. PDC88 TaxID=1884375 RepID=UPI000B868B04|nr:LysR family transcriptional regulator [Paenibacillus sp. PDC88]
MFRQLECFIQICIAGSFTKAAEVLMISQPTLSQQIRFLEAEVGTPLFERFGRGIKITADGEILYVKALSVMRLLDEAKKETNELRHAQARVNKLSIGISPMDFLSLAPLFLKFHEQYPDISVQFTSGEYTTQQLLNDSIDIGITDNPNPNKEIHTMHLHTEEQALAVYAGHPWADRTSVSFRELGELDTPLFACDLNLHEQLHASNPKSSSSLQSMFESTSNSILLTMVLQHMGVAILPVSSIENHAGQPIKMIRLIDPTPVREIKLMYKKYQYSNPSVQQCIEFLLEKSR